jgi:NAD(P)-dependent dehydrogenase (short-subunit alcohol dehydrogenase family)
MRVILLILTNKICLITGAGQGIGRAIALEFAREGATIVVNGLTLDKAVSVVNEIKEFGGIATPFKADISKFNEVEEMVTSAINKYKKIDILVNNAGIQMESSFLDLPLADWDEIMNVNLRGSYICSQLVARNMAKRNNGKIINIASIHYTAPRLGKIHYDVSKAGIVMLTKDMALELAQYHINVNCIAPGAIATDMNEDILVSPDRLRETISRIPWGRIGKPEDVARAALFLASDNAEYITGSIFNVDGGLSLR